MSDEIRSSLTDCSDGRLAELVQRGDSEAFAELTARYMSIIRARVSPFRSGRMENEDLCQEGLLGLLKAAQTYDFRRRRASFRTYAGVCISHQVIMAYRSAAGRKNDPLSDFISLSGDDAPEFAADGSADPEALVADREEFRLMCRRVSSLLTPMEQQVLRLYLGGCSYREIAEKLSVTVKAADNALQRARLKLKQGDPIS